MNNRFFKKDKPVVIAKNKLNIDNLDMFPELKINNKQPSANNDESNIINFKNVLNTKVKEINNGEKEDIILPGWIKITRNGNTLVYEYEKTKEIKKMKLKNNTEIIEEIIEDEDIDKNMRQTIFKMEYNWYKYEYNYDQIHGEGSYIEKYRLPPVYGPEYDTDIEPEMDESDFIVSDDENNNNNDYDNFY